MSSQRPVTETLDIAHRLERLIAELETNAPEPVLERTRELARLLNDLHAAALGRILELVEQAQPEVLARLLDDDVVASLLVLHDLHPEPPRRRVERALARLGSTVRHRLVLADLEPGAARVRAEAMAPDPWVDARGLEQAIRDAVQAMAPDVEHVDVERRGTEQLVQIQGLRASTPGANRR